MSEPVDLRAELDRVATEDEPPLTLDTDRLVASGYRRLRRYRVLRGGAITLATAGALVFPALVFIGPGVGGQGQAAGGGTSIEPTPGAPHGGCVGQTISGSTEAAAMAQWLQPRLPTRQRYQTDGGWQVAERDNCYDGAHQDSNDVGFRVTTHAGDIDVTTARNDPAERPQPICRTEEQISASARAESPPPPAATGQTANSAAQPGGTRTRPPTGSPTSPDTGQVFTICRRQPQPGGDLLTIEEWRWPGGPNSSPDIPAIGRTVRFYRADGTVVSVVADNRDVSATPAAAQPPLTINEMVALAKNRGLQLFIPHPR
jgi:hypothetical protein